MSDPDYRQQLDSALLHAEDEHTFAKVKVTYALMINLREAGSDEKVHEVYRTFLKVNENKLRLWGPIRFVLMEAAEFAKAVKHLRYEEVLSFRTELFAAALDDLHETIWDKDLPEDFDWMADRVCGVIYKGQQMDASVFPGPRAVE